jgi:hypothetical protein
MTNGVSVIPDNPIYGGVRAFTASAGPGLSLMMEAIGLSGMTETPLVHQLVLQQFLEYHHVYHKSFALNLTVLVS